VTRVVCAGHVNWDVTLHVDALPEPDGEGVIGDQSQAAGGSAANTAAGLASLGVETTLLGSVGDDEHGHLARRELAGTGVDCSPLVEIEAGATTVKYLVVDADGQVMVLANEGVNEAFGVEDLDGELLGEADHLHLTGQCPETAAALAREASAAGVSVSLDPGRRVDARDYHDAARHVSYLFLNDREATRAQENGLIDSTDGMTVVTRGASGGEVKADDGTITHPGFDIEAVDTAGAGDAFAAGFLAARFDGADLEGTLAVANAAGALAARTTGARTDLSWAEIDALRHTG
jgi:ribokinase